MDTQFPQSAVPPAFAQYAPQLLPQGFPIGGLIGGIGGLLGNPTLGRPIGTAGGGFLPFSVDPLTAAYAQQVQQAQLAQLAPQGFFGNLLGQFGQPLGGAIGSIFGQPALGNQLGAAAGQLGRFLPFSVDPLTAAYAQQLQQAQQAQLAPQGFFGNLLGQLGAPLGSAIGSIFGNPVLGNQLGAAAGQFGRFLPFQAGPGFPGQGGFVY